MANWLRIGLIVVFGATALALVEYAPLVPKLVTLLDDVHELRKEAPRIQKKIDETNETLKRLEKRIPSFFSEDGHGRTEHPK